MSPLALLLLIAATADATSCRDCSEAQLELFRAASIDDHDTINKLLNDGAADIKAVDDHGQIALHYAAAKGNDEAVKLLLHTHDADVNHRDENGWTALMLAARYGRAGVTKLLIEKGADLHVKTNIGRSAMDLARPRTHDSQGHQLTFHLLKEAGAVHTPHSEHPTAHESSAHEL